MFIAEMEQPLHIVLVSDAKSSLAEIMSGYLHFYGHSGITISLQLETPVIHPLAEQVLREDGIDFWGADSKVPKNVAKLTLYINSPKTSTQLTAAAKSFQFDDPLAYASYAQVLAAFRQTRELIKKVAIELVGEISVGL